MKVTAGGAEEEGSGQVVEALVKAVELSEVPLGRANPYSHSRGQEPNFQKKELGV